MATANWPVDGWDAQTRIAVLVPHADVERESELQAMARPGVTIDVAACSKAGGGLRRLVLALALLVTAFAAAAGDRLVEPARASAVAETLEERATGLGLACSEKASEDATPVKYTLCEGKLASWDSNDRWLETRLAFPTGAASPLPTLLGAGAGNWANAVPPVAKKAEGGGGPAEGGTTADEDCCASFHNNVPWFVSRGYAVLSQTARGFGGSCGVTDPNPVCATPTSATRAGRHTHIAERGVEARDYQHLLGLLVDAGIADRDRLGAIGGSYGGAITWLLSTSLPWKTPADGPPIQLAAAVPAATWTDLLQFAAPNGRAGDRLDRPDAHELPIGVFRKAGFELLRGTFHFFARMNSTDPNELHSFMDGWSAFFNKGEPYDVPEGKKLTAALRGKSAYYADDYLAAVRTRGVKPVPVFALQEWKDPFFDATQPVSMYHKLKDADAAYPIWMAFLDAGAHASGGVGDEEDEAGLGKALHHTLDEINAFLDAFVRGSGAPPSVRAFSYRQECPEHPHRALTEDQDVGGNDRVDASRWPRLTGGRPTVLNGHGRRTTTSTSQNPDAEASEGAQSVVLNLGSSRRCVVTHNPPTAPARWTFAQPLSYLGLPRLTVDYRFSAVSGDPVDATVIAHIWDVPPDDPATPERENEFRTLVDRGVYRLAGTGSDAEEGTLQFELFGNHWRFGPGHVLQLELSQTDDPYFRPDNVPSTIVFSSPALTLPGPRP